MRDYFLTARPTGPLLLLTRSAVINLLRDAARQVGLPCNSLKGHSFRIGAASTAAAASHTFSLTATAKISFRHARRNVIFKAKRK